MNHHAHHAVDGPELDREVEVTDAGGAGTTTGSLQPPDPPATTAGPPPGFWAGLWNAVTGLIATFAGIAPHVLHHIGLFAGAFLVTGAAGNLLFGTLGLVLSIPLLRRLYRRFDTWKAPAVAVAVFAVMFSISAFVIGPAIDQDEPPAPVPGQGPAPDDHAGHHG